MRNAPPNNRLVALLLMLGLGWLLIFQPMPGWSGSLEISSVRVAVSLHSDSVRFRTGLFENGQLAAMVRTVCAA